MKIQIRIIIYNNRLLSTIFLDKENLPGYIPLTIYLPGKEKCVTYIHLSSQIKQLIFTVIKENIKFITSNNLPDESKYYELRMHELDGEPDEDFPAYDNGQLIKDIIGDDEDTRETTFCMCIKEDITEENEEENVDRYDLTILLPTKKTSLPITRTTTVIQVLEQLVIGQLIERASVYNYLF